MANLLSRDGELLYRPGFIEPPEADGLFRRLLAGIPWQDEVATDAGARVRLPRAVRWFGDPESIYPYAGFTHRPLPWNPLLLELKQRVEAATARTFNGVLCNLYRGGSEAMGWHRDLEPVLGDEPCIASISLGAERRMGFRHEATDEQFELSLASGSLLVMTGRLQQCWLHRIPAMPEVETARINLNFRSLAVSSIPDGPCP